MMKQLKTGSLLLILSASLPLYAQQASSKSLSFGVSLGLNTDMAGLGETIATDGTLDTAETSMMNQVYGTGEILPPSNKNTAAAYNSSKTNSAYTLIESGQADGPLTGIDAGLHAQLELDSYLDMPLFTRVGFNYATSVSGGDLSRTLGDVAGRNPGIAGVLGANGLDPADYNGGKMDYAYSSSYMEIPITVGFKILEKDQSFLYGGLGISLFKGGFSIDINADEKYANALATHVDFNTGTATNYHTGGAVKDTIDFQMGGIGINYLVGLQWGFTENWAMFLELNSSGALKEVFSSSLKEKTARLLTAASSETLAKNDSQWYKRIAYPVRTGGTSIRIGVRGYIY